MATKRVKKRKPKKKFIVLLVIIAFLLIGTGVYLFFSNRDSLKEKRVVSTISKYNYTLKSNKSSAYKKLFQELKKVLSEKKVDEKKYVKIISEMFIVDFYSLNDHVAKTDVGGIDFIHPDAEANFVINAEDTMYKYVESNIYKQRKQKLPEVDEVKIESVDNTEYTYNDNTDEDAYEVKVSWTYKDSSIADEYQSEATLIFIHNDIKLVLVELSNGQEEED